MPPLLYVSLAVALVSVAAAACWLARERSRLKGELAAVRGLFSRCMDLAPFNAYIKDSAGRYVYVNPAALVMIRRDLPHVGSVLGRTDKDFIPDAISQPYVDDDLDVLRHGTPRVFENTSVAADGTVRQWLTLKFPWTDARGGPCVAGISVDVSEARLARELARESEHRCALALEAGRMGTLTLDLATHQLETSALFAVLHGRPETATRLGLTDSLAEVHPDDRASIMEAVQAALRDAAPSRIVYRVVKPHGDIAWIELTGQVFTDDAGQPAVVRGVAFDITEQQQALEELHRRKDSLRRLIEAQENERQMLCAELHDGVLQYIVGAIMLLEAHGEKTGMEGPVGQAGEVVRSLKRGLAEGRQLIRGVRPAVLDDLGLTAAVHDLTEQMATFGMTVEVAIDEDLDRLPLALRTTVYRVVQESLANVRKHAETRRAEVEIRLLGENVSVCVSDAGKGFDTDADTQDGFGIRGMTERVQLAGGTCLIESRPGAGSRVVVRLPIPDDD